MLKMPGMRIICFVGSEQRAYGICNLSVYSTVEAQSTMAASRLVELPERERESERVSGTYSTSAFSV